MQSDKIKEATRKFIELFESGDLPPVVARTIIKAKSNCYIPSDTWSLGNRIIMMLAGTEDARGFRQWEKVGRRVKKGAKAFYILAPKIIKVKDEETEEEKHVLAGFLSVPVFRYEDTEGKELVYPDYTPPVLPPLVEVAEQYGVSIRYVPFRERFYGSYRPSQGEILLCTYDELTFFHELAHAVHDKIKPLKCGQHSHQEIIAETVAAVLCIIYDLEGYLYDAKKYIESYSKHKDPLRSIMQVLSEVEQVLNMILAPNEGMATSEKISTRGGVKKLDAPKIEKKNFKIERVYIQDGCGRVGSYLAICYKGIPLWRTIDSNLDNYEFFLYDPREYAMGEPFVLICKDSFGDLFTYGSWRTLEEALAWLENPVPLY